ncbi:hypothetical protein Acsp04_14770 [Actinomadura sp. NBRC 104425]|uniref:hypothetical protein n=1 Tax=Actinomadura sp. NBRC 104425 TaxID=3032204 RepID=UPI0024A5BB47|nr:hypothetical protein [Actinomadura sp. NBRC 104425]GLZ11242.1 hypothetical protein Acsp04_14770 [Actinomadura sp. NBRC 104425]
MGTDWVPAAVRDGAEPREVASLAAEHARLAHLLGLTSRPRPAGTDEDAAARRFRDVDRRLRGLLLVDGPPFRVMVVGRNPRFPPEWRDAAWTTLPPREAEEAYGRWRGWYEHVRAGRMRHYLERLRAWDMARDLAEIQRELTGAARAAEGRANAWARKPRFLQAREDVLALPPVPAVPPPGPVPGSAAQDRPQPGQDERWEAVVRHAELLGAARRAFNRSVPGGYRCGWSLWEGDAGAEDPWLEEFFEWLAAVVRTGRGLYLWA